jgi:gliding motility-associated-like protein
MIHRLPFIFLFRLIAITLIIIAGSPHYIFSQSGNCHPATPFYNVDLSANPNGSWTSPQGSRSNLCCGNSSPDRCVEFSITLSPDAIAINFQIASGAVPPGAMFYQVNCGTPVQVGSPICLNGPGPYTLTFCKPGNNPNAYAITSIAAPEASPDKTVGHECNTDIWVSGLVTSSISWTSISPGIQGAYNSYLNCASACTNPTVTPASNHPTYVDYQVCGTPNAGVCASPGQFCDTVRVYMSPPIISSVNPNPASFCVNNPTVLLTGNVSGGVPPYTYIWTNAANGGGSTVSTDSIYTATVAGTYSFIVRDQNYPSCPGSSVNVPVTSKPLPVVNAGNDIITCGTSVNLQGTVTGATGGIWSGGNGGFMPGNIALTTTYSPSLTELNNGTVVLTLTSTGNAPCSAVSDQITLSLSPPLSVTINAPSVLCYGQNATLAANITGGTGPFTYLWNTGATSQTITPSASGTYSVTVTGAGPGFCSANASYTLNANPQIITSTSPNNAVACTDLATISASATGGTGTFSYLWSTGQTSSSISVSTGTYIVTITDGAGCSAYDTVSVTASSSLAVSLNQPSSTICNGSQVTLIATPTGGLGGNTFLWNTGATTNSITVGAGNHCVTVTDNGGCNATACSSIIIENPILTVTVPTPSIICNGATTTVNANVSGGQAPYTFLWNTGNTNQSLTSSAGTYTVIVTDAIGCKDTANVTISESPVLAVSANALAVSCSGGNNGSATAVVSGGTPSYSYAWSPFGGTGLTANNLTAGSYSVAVTDSKGCSATASVSVSQPQVLSANTSVQQHVLCNGASNGTATVNTTGGNSPYTYLWSPGGATTQSVNTLSAGTYSIVVTDNKGCTINTSTTINQPTVITASTTTITNVTCNGNSNGSASINVSGGSPSYTYAWLPTGGNSNSASGLTAGNYTVTITDSLNCTLQHTLTITQPLVLSASIGSSNNVSCNAGNDGMAIATALGGTAPYTYSWNTTPIQTNDTALNLIAGSYFVTVTDANNCSANSSSTIITEPTVLTVTASPSVLISCDSAITITSIASGGTGTYSYQWSTGATTTSINVNTGSYYINVTDQNGCIASDTVSVQATNSSLAVSINQPPNICNGSTIAISAIVTGGLGSNSYLWNTGATTSSITVGDGSYCVTVTDAGGCITTGCVTVIENPIISINVSNPPNVCPGDSAMATVNALGGEPPYSYLWNTGETTQSVIKPAGTYTVTLSDVTGNGCAASAVVTVTETNSIALSLSHTDVSCYGAQNGTATAYASGGTPDYNYLWQPTGITTATATLLASITHTITVTDSIGCVITDSVSITQPLSPIAISSTATHNICYGDSTGTASISPSGGTAPYYFLWSIIGDTTNAVTNLAAGSYIATVADTTGCFISDTIVIEEPAELVLITTPQQFDCYGETGSMQLSASGGTGLYVFSGDDSTNLVAGIYNYIVTDSSGCTASSQDTILAGPPPFTITATPTPIACFGGTGSVNLTYSGGNGTIVITGDDTTNLVAGTYNYTATDSTGCTATAQVIINTAPSAVNIATTVNQIVCYGTTATVNLITSGGTGNLIIAGDDTTNLLAGTYTYIVTDSNGCADTAQAIVNNGPPAFILTATPSIIECYGETASVTLNTSGGTAPFSFSGDDTTNLATGTYTYVVTDSNSCTDTAQAIVAPGPAVFTLTAIANQINCFGGTGSVSLNLTGGIGTVIISGDDTTNLVAGTYNYTATDSMGCTATSQVIIDTAPDSLVLNINAVHNTCYNSVDGSATVVVNGGTAPFQYIWDNGSTATSIINLVPDTYTIAVVDSNGCATSDSINITEPTEIIVNITNIIASQCNLNNGSATANVSGGISPYLYSWSPSGGSNSIVDSLFPGNYTVTVSDSNNCQKQQTVTIDSSSFVIANFNTTAVCLNNPTIFSDSSIVSVGSTITSWQWNFDDTTPIDTSSSPTHLYTSAGSFNVMLTVTSSDGCISTTTIPVEVYELPIADFTSSKVCFNLATSFIDISNVATNDTIISWSWDFGDNSTNSFISEPSHIYDAPGDYTTTLIVSSSKGCIDTISAEVTVYENPVVQFSIEDTSGCFIHCTNFADLTTTSGFTISSWAWSFGDGSAISTNSNTEHCYTNSGDYSVSLTVTTNQGCSSTHTQNSAVTIFEAPNAAFDFLPSSPVSIINAEISFENLSTGSTSWNWNFGDPFDTALSVLQHPMHVYSDTGTYCITLIAKNTNQCADTIAHCLKVEPDFTFFIPNAFSPFDSQGTNDNFSGYGTNISQYDMWIFDRWGNMIFHTADLNIRWDGKANNGKDKAQRDVYVYLVKILDFRGTEHEYRGTVTLVR